MDDCTLCNSFVIKCNTLHLAFINLIPVIPLSPLKIPCNNRKRSIDVCLEVPFIAIFLQNLKKLLLRESRYFIYIYIY